MKLKEAIKIVNYILDWQFVLMGVKERDEIKDYMDLSDYTLEDLIKANKLVKSENNRKDKFYKYWSEKTGKSYPRSVRMLLADRIIAGVYTCLNFSSNGEMIALINDHGCGVVKAKYN